MVAPPPVWGLLHSPRRWWLAISAYVVGMLVGALALAGIMTGIDLTLTLPRSAGAIAGLALVVPACLVSPMLFPQSRWRIPREWERLGKVRYSAIFGFVLGVAILTAIPAISFYFLIIYALVAGPAASMVIFVSFGLARAVPVIVAARHAATTKEYPVGITDRLSRLASGLKFVEVGFLLASAIALLGL